MSTPFQIEASSIRPMLLLGLVGFDEAARQMITSQLGVLPVRGVSWRVVPFAHADAWLANGPATQLLGPGEVLVGAETDGESPVRLWLPEVDGPIAFSLPLATAGFAPATFELSPASLTIALARFAQTLRPKAVLLYVADLLVQNAVLLRRSRIYHLMVDHRLVGVVDLKGSIAVLPEAKLADIARASWVSRPDSADFVPESFAQRDTRELLWDYASRTDRPLLPEPMRAAPVYLRREPAIPRRLVSDSQLFVLRELAQAPRTYGQLCDSAIFPPHEIASALGGLYLIGSVTTLPDSFELPQRGDPRNSNLPWSA